MEAVGCGVIDGSRTCKRGFIYRSCDLSVQKRSSGEAALEIIAPWSLSTYIPLNGFHPLYRSLASATDRRANLLTPRIPGPSEYSQLMERGDYSGHVYPRIPPWVRGAEASVLFHEYINRLNAQEITFLSNLPGDIELHHTAPMTAGDRPFFLHVESFVPTFFPWLNQGKDHDRGSVEKVRRLYASLFESPLCLGIASHLQETLDQLSHFFRNSTIEEKLILSPIGLDESYIDAGAEKKQSDEYKFIFLNSAHQHRESFSLRGGEISLAFALRLLRSGVNAKFFFRTARPTRQWLRANDFDPDEVSAHEGGKIIWVQNYLSTQTLIALVAHCHFLLLPSANLHSVSIMSAMANGTIPIVTDTLGTRRYVKNGETGIVLDGVYDAIWSVDDQRMIVDSHAAFWRLRGALTDKLEREIRSLLNAPDRIRQLAANCRLAIRKDFSGSQFAEWIFDEIQKRFVDLPGKCRSARDRPLHGARWFEEVQPAHYEGPPLPFELVNSGTGKIFKYGRHYIYVPPEKLTRPFTQAFWSPLTLAHERISVHIPPHQRVLVCPSLGDAMAVAQARHMPVGGSPPLHAFAIQSLGPRAPISVAELIAGRLRRNSVPYRSLRAVWRLYKKARGMQ